MRTKGRSPGERPAPGCPEQRTQSHPGGLRGPGLALRIPACRALRSAGRRMGSAAGRLPGVATPMRASRMSWSPRAPVSADPPPGPACKVPTVSTPSPRPLGHRFKNQGGSSQPCLTRCFSEEITSDGRGFPSRPLQMKKTNFPLRIFYSVKEKVFFKA